MPKTSRKSFNLYWVETPSPEENAFVAARSSLEAATYEEDGTGFEDGDCVAYLVRPLDAGWIAQYRVKNTQKDSDCTGLESSGPFYVLFEDLEQLGINWRMIEGDDVFSYGDIEYVKQGDLNYLNHIVSLARAPQKIVIRSVTDLLEIIRARCPRRLDFSRPQFLEMEFGGRRPPLSRRPRDFRRKSSCA